MLDPVTLKSFARSLGFVACGVTNLSPPPHSEALDHWLRMGYAGSMRYLHRQAKNRKNPSQILARAVRAVVTLDNYYYSSGAATTDQKRGTRARIARYALGRDYHLATGRRLNELAEFLRQNGAKIAKAFVDAGPVPERELAQRAGLGWIGKNTMLIHPGLGSFFFIGAVLTDLPIGVDLPFEADRCGSCTRCLDACPTAAFVAERVLDATRCISYLTIEHRGPIPEQFTGRLEGWGFGCDICNEVCPWNERFAQDSTIAEFRPRGDLSAAGPGFFDELTEEEFRERFGDTPLERAGLEGMRRNWKAAL